MSGSYAKSPPTLQPQVGKVGYDGAWIGSGGGVTLNWKMHLSEWKLSGTRLLDELSSELSDDDGLC